VILFAIDYVCQLSQETQLSRLTRNISPPKSDTEMAQTISLQEKFYPIRTSLPSCIQLPEADGDTFELKLQFINTPEISWSRV